MHQGCKIEALPLIRLIKKDFITLPFTRRSWTECRSSSPSDSSSLRRSPHALALRMISKTEPVSLLPCNMRSFHRTFVSYFQLFFVALCVDLYKGVGRGLRNDSGNFHMSLSKRNHLLYRVLVVLFIFYVIFGISGGRLYPDNRIK